MNTEEGMISPNTKTPLTEIATAMIGEGTGVRGRVRSQMGLGT